MDEKTNERALSLVREIVDAIDAGRLDGLAVVMVSGGSVRTMYWFSQAAHHSMVAGVHALDRKMATTMEPTVDLRDIPHEGSA